MFLLLLQYRSGFVHQSRPCEVEVVLLCNVWYHRWIDPCSPQTFWNFDNSRFIRKQKRALNKWNWVLLDSPRLFLIYSQQRSILCSLSLCCQFKSWSVEENVWYEAEKSLKCGKSHNLKNVRKRCWRREMRGISKIHIMFCFHYSLEVSRSNILLIRLEGSSNVDSRIFFLVDFYSLWTDDTKLIATGYLEFFCPSGVEGWCRCCCEL